MNANRCHYSFNKILNSTIFSGDTKLKYYKTVIEPAFLYSVKAWVFLRKPAALITFETKDLRESMEKNPWRIRKDKGIRSPQRLRCIGSRQLI